VEIIGTATKVTIYVGESDHWGQKSLYMAILEMLKAEDCAGATVTRGLAGFGAHSRIRTASIVDLSSDLPLVIEWVDDPARVARVMPRLTEMVSEGLITCQEVEVVNYSHRGLRALRAAAPVRDLMSREVRTVTPDMPIADAVEMLIGQAYRSLPVVDEAHRIVGILTDGDLLTRLGLPDASVQSVLTAAELGRELDALRRSGKTVRELMVSPVITTTEDAAIVDAIHIMAAHGIKRVPVVDRSGRVVGIVSRVDVLRALAQPLAREAPERVPTPGQHTWVKDVMVAEVPTVQSSTPLNTVVDLLVNAAHRRIVVVDAQRHVLGIITDGDLLKRASATERTGMLQAFSRRLAGSGGATIDLARRSAGEVMTANPITVTPDTPLLEALRLLLQHKIKRLPVVDESGQLVGLVGRGEILQALATDQSNAFDHLP
jgi:CBS-domain-containing membrane protein